MERPGKRVEFTTVMPSRNGGKDAADVDRSSEDKIPSAPIEKAIYEL